MKKIYFNTFNCLLTILLSCASGLAQTTGDFRTAQSSVTWSTSGNWQTWDGSQWSTSASAPGSGNDVYIQAGHTVTLTSAQSCNSLFISTGTSNATTGGDGLVTLQGNTLSVSGKLSCYFGAVNTTGGSGSALSITTSTTTPSSPITKTSGGVLKFVGNSRNLTNTNEWGAGASGSSSLFDVEFALNSGQTGTLVSVLKAANWKISSGTLISSGRIAVDNGTTAQGDVTIADGATLISGESGSGTTPVISRTTSAICGTVTINGLLKLNGSSPHIQCSAFSIGTQGKVEYSRAGNQTFLAASYLNAVDLLDYQHIIISGSGTKTTLASVTTDLGADGSLTIAGGSLGIGSAGTFSVSTSSTTLIYSGSSSQTASATEWHSNFQNITINNTTSVSLGFSRTVNGILTLAYGVFTNGTNLTLGNGALIIRTNGSLNSSPTFGSTINVIYEQSGSSISSANELPTGSSILNNLTINNSSGVILTSSVTVNGLLTLTEGKLTTSNSSMVTIASGGNSTPGNVLGYVDGPLKKFGNTDFVFPIGKGSTWARAALKNISGSSGDYFIAEYFDTPPANQTSLGNGLSGGRISSKEYWEISSNTSINAKLTLYWEDGSFSGLNSLASSDLVVAHYSGSAWVSDSSSISTGTTTSGNVTSKTITSWGNFTFGSPNNANALPVKLAFFKLKSTDSSMVFLEWATVSENLSHKFDIERSMDGINFFSIGGVLSKAPGGMSSQIIHYSYGDRTNLNRLSYYRLKQSDYDGHFNYSPIIKNSVRKSDQCRWVITNKTLLFLSLNEPLNEITIGDFKGQDIVKRTAGISDPIDLSNLAEGFYYLRINHSKPVKVFIK